MLTELLLQGAVLSAAPWLSPFIGYASSKIILHLPTFCAVDPPSDPGVSAADLLGLIALGPGPLTSGSAQKVEQLIMRLAWSYFCECATGTLTPPAPVSPPAGIPSINPGGYVPPVAVSPCLVDDRPTPVELEAHDSLIRGILDGRTLGPTAVRVTGSTALDGDGEGPVVTLDILWSYVDPDGAQSNQIDDNRTLPVGSFLFDVPAPTGTNFVDCILTADDGTGTTSVVLRSELFCNGQMPGGTVQPCCPPDPIATALLTQIYSMVTLLQRQLAPFAYITGPEHSGLTGTGSFAIQGVIGVLLNVSVPSRAGVEVGTPDTVFDCGWINFGTADGWSGNRAIRADSQVVFPEVAGAYVNLGYTLGQGVTMTVTELLREA